MSRMEFRLPDVGEGLSEGEIVRWLVEVGDTVARDQALVEIETDKSLVELPAPQDGVVLELKGSEGDVFPVGELLLVLEVSGDVPSIPNHAEQAPSTAVAPAAVAEGTPPAFDPSAASPVAGEAGPRPKAAPAVRKLAVEHGVDLGAVVGSGPNGKITKEDVLQAAGAGAPQPPARVDEPVAGQPPTPATQARARSDRSDQVEPLRGLRRQIAKTMTLAWQQVPHITDIREIDATALVAARKSLMKELSGTVERLTYLPLLVRALTETLRTSPKFNASIDMDAERITYHGRMNIGIAAATNEGLLVPVIHDADQMALGAIARRIDELAEGARARSLSPQEMRDGTCTITNFGSFGGWIASPIIRPPESAIVGFGRIRDRVVAVDGEVVIRPTLTVCVSADHRLIDGDDMGAFLNRITELVEDPFLMIAGGH